MGKKQNRKQHINKIQEAISNLTNDQLNDDDFHEKDSNYNEFKFDSKSNCLTEANIMISKLISDSEKDREVAAHLLASTDISSLGEGKYYTYSNKPFFEAMISCFVKSNVSTKANIIAGFINILVSSPLKSATGAVHEPEKILLFSLNITDILLDYIKKFISSLVSSDYSDKNLSKEQTLYELIIDLYVYFSEITILSKEDKNVFEPLILVFCEIIINSNSLKNKLTESSLLNTIYVITELLGLRLLSSDNNNILISYKNYLQNKVDEIASNNLIDQLSEALLLYLGSIFYVLFYSDSNVSINIKQIISFIVSNMVRFDSVFVENLKFINEKLLSVLNTHEDDETENQEGQMIIDNEKKNNLSEDEQLKLVKEIRDKALKSELILKGIIQVTKIFNDIFHCYQIDEIQIQGTETKDEDWEEVSEESIDDEESKVQSKIISIFENKTNIIQCFSLDQSNGLFNSLYFFVNATENHTVVADSPHSIAIEELLHELEYSALS